MTVKLQKLATIREKRALTAVDLLVIYAVAANLAAWTCAPGWLGSPVLLWGVLLSFMVFLRWVLNGGGGGRGRPSRFRRHRCKRLLPCLYFVTFGLVLIAVVLYPEPNNYDHLTYRFPRLLHWWSQGRWFWVEGADPRLNYSGVGFEWMWYPFFLLWRSDTGAALVNLAGYALLPGLVFRVFTGFGLSPRLAAVWMWVLPSAYCFLLQAAGAGNDMISAVFVLIAFSSLLEGRREGSFRATGVGALSAALLSGIKLSNVPLLLPLGLLLVSRRNLQGVLRFRFMPVLLACAVVSFLPMAVINLKMTGDYTGDSENRSQMRISSPLAAAAGNLLQAGVAAVTPPVNPLAGPWNDACTSLSSAMPVQWLLGHYPRFSLRVREIVGEEDGGLGLGITAFLLFSLAFTRRKPRGQTPFHTDPRFWALLAFLFACGVFTVRLGSESSPRIAAPYYPLLLALPFLVLKAERFRRPRLVTAAAALCMALPWLALLLTPSRPLIPWKVLMTVVPERTRMAGRMRDVYALYAQRHDAFLPLKEAAGDWSGVRHIGVSGLADDPEASLWKPIDGRTVHHIAPGVPPSAFPALDVVAGRRAAVDRLLASTDWKEWSGSCRRSDVRFVLKARTGQEDWVVLVKPIHEN